eukprot:scaffold276594_cov28-Tisochrysis_lutea.AAC.1
MVKFDLSLSFSIRCCLVGRNHNRNELVRIPGGGLQACRVGPKERFWASGIPPCGFTFTFATAASACTPCPAAS